MIEISRLTKEYGAVTALNEFSVTVADGVVFGFVGPNGAGKSTVFSILATLLSPTSGSAIVNGFDVTKQPEQVRKRIGYMPDFFGVYDQLKVKEYLDFYGACYRLSEEFRERRIPELLELVKLTSKKDTYVDLLSRGMKQRLCLARALIHDPDVLILDEPASGLDPRARIEMRNVLKQLKTMGKTILISSHILPELAEMCDALCVMENGKPVVSGSVAMIEQTLQVEKVLRVSVLNEIEKAIRFFEDAELVSNVELDEDELDTVAVSFKGTDQDQSDLLEQAINDGLAIRQFSEEKTNLEDIFFTITKGDGS